jgi:GNAT superfamily N-acetyltransferase/RimJ/RimL family protein N-acetyltransferase
MIARLDLAAIHDLRLALPRFARVPLSHLRHLNPEQRQAYWLDEISQSLAKESSVAFVSIVSGTINGFIVYNDSPWDSEITGRRIGTVEHIAVAAGDDSGTEILQKLLDELTPSLADRGTQCVVCKVHSTELPAIHALEHCGFLLMDTLLDFVFDFSRTTIEEIHPPRRDEQLNIRRAKPADLSALMAINEKAFTGYFGRYHADPQMPPGTATKIYAQWVRSAFQGWADWILVAEVDERLVGYGLWRKPLEIEARNSLSVAHYDLAAIDPGFLGRGLWTALMFDGMHIARNYAQYLVGPVHVCNYPVQHTLQKLGWRISGARHSFHKWLN